MLVYWGISETKIYIGLLSKNFNLHKYFEERKYKHKSNKVKPVCNFNLKHASGERSTFGGLFAQLPDPYLFSLP